MQQTTMLEDTYTPVYLPSPMIMEDSRDYRKNNARILKRIPLHRLMDLKIDYAFKQLFGNEKNKDIMIVFLNAILQRTGRKPIKDVTFLNIEVNAKHVNDKESRLDLLVVTNANEKVNVEIQFTNQYNMVKRSLYYWAGIYRSSLQRNVSYKELQTVISINILNFSLLNQTKQFHTTFHLYEDEEQFQLTDAMEFHFIEMSKLIKAWKEDALDPWNDILARWLLLLGMVDHRNNEVYEDIFRELEEIAMKDETLKQAFNHWEELSMEPEEFLAYESRLKRILDEESALREAELRVEEGLKEGRKEGKKEGKKEAKIETARRLLIEGMDIEFVKKITELPLEEISEIKRHL